VVFWLTILLHVVSILFSLSGFIAIGTSAEASIGEELVTLLKQNALIIFNEIYRIIMVVLFTSFAYDSAKRQLEREKDAK
jgi:hypothetical protein